MSNAALETFIAGVESLRDLNERVAKDAEKGVLDAVKATASAAETPSGEAWPARKDGGKALPNAASEIQASTKGNRIELKIGEPLVYHQHGAGGTSTSKAAIRHRRSKAKSGTVSKFHAPKRQVLPASGDPIPATVNEAITKAAKKAFEKATG